MQSLSEFPIRVLLLSDCKPYSSALKGLLDHQSDLLVCGQVFKLDEVFPAIVSTNPHLIILDIDHSVSQRINLGKSILAQYPHLKIALLTFSYNLAFVGKAKRAGFHGYMSKEPDPNDVMCGVRAILDGQRYFTILKPDYYPEVLGSDEFTRRLTLNFRQIEIISMMRRGCSTKDMMYHFLVEPQTIHAHKQVIYRKLGINKEADIIQFAIRQGL